MIKRLLKISIVFLLAFFLAIGGVVLYINVYKAEIEANISTRLTETFGKPVRVKNVGSYLSLRAFGLTLESAVFDESFVKNILIEINPLASLVEADLVVSHVVVKEARIKITREMMAPDQSSQSEAAKKEKEESEADTAIDFPSIIRPINRVSELFREISVENVVVEVDTFDDPVRLEKLTLSRPEKGRLLSAELRHLDASVHLDIDIHTSQEKIEIRKLELVSKDLVVTPDFQLWLPVEQRLQPLPVEEFHLIAAGEAVGQIAKLELSRLKFKTGFIDADVKGQAEFNSGSGDLSYKVEGQVRDIGLTALVFMPKSVLDEKTSTMIQTGITGLKVSQGYLLAEGGIKGLSSLLLTLSVEIESFLFDPLWPKLTAIKADVILTKKSVEVALHRVEFQGLALEHTTAKIEDFEKLGLVTTIKFAEEIPHILAALKETTLEPKLAELAKQVLIEAGSIDLELEMAFDLKAKVISPKITGHVDLAGIDLDVVAPPVRVRKFGGKLQFQADLVESDGLSFFVNDEPATLKFRHDDTKRPGQTDVHLDAKISSKMLEAIAGQEIEPAFAGRSGYVLKGKVLHTKTGMDISSVLSSDLVGTAVKLQGIFVKAAADPSKFLLNLNSLGEDLNATLALGDIVARTKVGMGKVLKLGAQIRLHDAGEPEAGRLQIELPAVVGDVTFDDQWKNIHARFKKLHIVTGEVDAPVQPEGKKVEASSDAAPAPPPPAIATEAAPKAGKPLDPRTLPILDLVIEDLQVGPRKIGRMDFLTTRIEDGLEVRKLNVEAGYFSQYNTRGSWLFNAGKPKIHLDSLLYLRDAGQALKSLGIYQDLSGIKGSVPLQLDIVNPVAEGTKNLDLLVAFDLRAGEVRNLDNVFLNILKIITFKEVLGFKNEGLLIRQAKGKVRFTDGKMTFINTGLELDSVALMLSGPLDFQAKTLDLKVTTKLRISRTLSTAAIASVNPVAAASMIATDTSFEFDFIDGLGEHTYEMNGSLDDPKLAAVDFDLLGKTGIKKGLKKLNLMEEEGQKSEPAKAGEKP